MENLVSLRGLLWQRALTTPPLVVLLLYLQNAQLSYKPALSAGARQAGWGGVVVEVGVNSCMLGGFSAACDIAGRQIFTI